MLDPETYRTSERLAKAQMPAWQIAQAHHVDHFEKVGFPVRVASIGELGPLLDTMQENRFDKYMRELGGFAAEEYTLLLDACRHAVLFQLTYFPNRQPVLPLSTLLSCFCLYKKMLGVDGSFRSVLEIGPGCGYLSFFLRHHPSLGNYSQIEACESFYILQNLVNMHCFGPDFEERALVPQSPQLGDFFVTPKGYMEFAPIVRIPREQPRCTHYPWWKIGDLVSREIKFDIVTSNANLLEFTEAALEDYLALIHRVLRPEGVFLVQCPGFPAHGTIDTLLDKLWDREFALLVMTDEGALTSPSASGEGVSLLMQLKGKGTASDSVTFAVKNALLVKAGHPLFHKFRERSNYRLPFIGDAALVDNVYFARPPRRVTYSMARLVEETEGSLQRQPAAAISALSRGA